MTTTRDAYLAALTPRQRAALTHESRHALRRAWPHRHVSGRAPHVIKSNVAMLRDLAATS